MPGRRHPSRWRAAAVRLGKPGVVLGGAIDRAAITGVGGLRAGVRGRTGEAEPPNEDRPGTAEDDAYRRIWTAAADRVGAHIEPLEPFEGGGFLRAAKGDRRAWLWRQETDLDGVTTLRLAADKPAVHRLLTAAGVAVPPHAVFDAADLQPGLRFLDEHGRCAVKPARGTARGQGVTTGVTTAADLDRAVLVAARQDRAILIEPHLDGPAVRLLFLDGELLDTVARHTPSLQGDGAAAVRELVAHENARRAKEEAHLGTSALAVDLDMALTLRAQNLDLKATPARGRRFTVKGVCNENAAAENLRLPEPPMTTVEQARAAAAALGLRLAGVDVVGDVVLEVNGTPGFLVHERAHGPETASHPVDAVLRALLAPTTIES